MNEDTVLERLCNLPIDFKKMNMSPIALVEQSGFFEFPHALSRDRIESFLRNSPALIDVWEGWSEDQRCSPAWIFQRRKDVQLVYRFPDGESFKFDDPFKACAEFVVREILSIAQFSPKIRA